MKNIFIISIIICSLFIVSSCTKIDQQIYDAPTPTNAIKSQSDVDNSIIGLYSQLNSWSGFKEQEFILYPWADDLSSTFSNAEGLWGAKINVNSGTPNTYNVWNRFYQAISNANAVISYTQTLSLNDTYKAKARAEAKFIRGLCYFYLVQYYGAVPLTTTVFDANTNLQPTRASVDSVYQLILADFSEGVTTLPTRTAQPTSEFNRATQGAALGFMAKANLTYANYLDLNKRTSESVLYYGRAKAEADSLINSGQYSLLSDYAKLYDVTNKVAPYSEVIFGIAYSRDPTVVNVTAEGSNWAAYFNPSTKPNSGGNGAFKTGNGAIKVHPWFYDKYNSAEYVNDYRVATTFTTTWINTTGKTVVTYPLAPPTGGLTESQPYINKYNDPGSITVQNCINDLYLLRLSEIYLIKAEAENELNGPTAIAMTAFNAVRARARLANGTLRSAPADLVLAQAPTKEAMRMKIFDERGLEFVGEFNRWFDLVRMRYSDNARTMYEYQFGTFLPTLTAGLPTYNTTTKVWSTGRTEKTNIIPFDKKYLLYPIPANEIAVNQNMSQNPGW
jgi:hypothetical protein